MEYRAKWWRDGVIFGNDRGDGFQSKTVHMDRKRGVKDPLRVGSSVMRMQFNSCES